MIRSDRKEALNFRLALDLYEAGEDLRRESLRREHPEASEAEIEQLVVEWLRTRPGAPYGDSPGRRVEPDAWTRR